MTEPTPLDHLHSAVQAWSNSLADDSREGVGMVNHSLVVWEETSYDEDGNVQRLIAYAATGDSAGPASSLGLATHLLRTLERDIIGCDHG